MLWNASSRIQKERHSYKHEEGRDSFGQVCLQLKPVAVTRVDRPELFIASHCKPWRECDNSAERLEVENGLMLTPNIYHLFDRGFISYENNGNLLISPVTDMGSMEKMGIDVSGV